MAEKRSERLKVVIELAERAENDAAHRFDDARQALDKELKILQSIEEYYADYEQQFQRETQGITAAHLMQSRDFLMRLSDAKLGQQGHVSQAKDTLETIKLEWHKVHLRHKALKELVAQYKRQEYSVLEKIEQKNLDEWVTQQR